jgi:hypothetical protein
MSPFCRNAIRARNVIEGITKEQAFCVPGAPQSIESAPENGVSVEIWHPRQEDGTRQPYHNMKPNCTGYPATMKFAGDKLIAVEKSGGKVE